MTIELTKKQVEELVRALHRAEVDSEISAKQACDWPEIVEKHNQEEQQARSLIDNIQMQTQIYIW